MTQEDKDLLLRDLCARLPYYPKCELIDEIRVVNNKKDSSYISTLFPKHIELFSYHNNFTIKPYLFPLSSMTEEQKKEFDQLLELELKAINDEIDPMQATIFEVDFYNKHHLDWRGLIPKGLAIDATGKNIY